MLDYNFMTVRIHMTVRMWLFDEQLLECVTVRMYNVTIILRWLLDCFKVDVMEED